MCDMAFGGLAFNIVAMWRCVFVYLRFASGGMNGPGEPEWKCPAQQHPCAT